MSTYTDLIGVTMASVTGKKGDEQMTFTADDGRTFVFFHAPDCCEGVSIEDIAGDLADLVGTPILLADEVVQEGENPEGVTPPEFQDSFTWTFYRFHTLKGSVTVRWYGESNGYYSERVAFASDPQ